MSTKTKAELIAEMEALGMQLLEANSKRMAAEELSESRKALLDEMQAANAKLNARLDKAIEVFRSQQAQIKELSAKRPAPRKSNWQPGSVAQTYTKRGESWQKVRGDQPGRFSHRRVEAHAEA